MRVSFMTSFFCSQPLKGIEIQTTAKSLFPHYYAKICNVDWQEVVLTWNRVTIEIIDVSFNLVTSYV